MKKWIAMFSQTGTEILNLIEKLDRVPERIICNNKQLENVNPKLLEKYYHLFWLLPDRPKLAEYETCLTKKTYITMHGWLRIIPEFICNQYNIYNLHPAPLTRYPHLKGKDPQIRCFEEGLEYGGNTIHICTPELDSGSILAENEIYIKGLTKEQTNKEIYDAAFRLWLKFLTKELL